MKQWKNISTSAKNLIRHMLHPDPSLRIKAEDALQHEWILLNKLPREHQFQQPRQQYSYYHSGTHQQKSKKSFYEPIDHTFLAQSLLGVHSTNNNISNIKNHKSALPTNSLKWSFLNCNNLETTIKPSRKHTREDTLLKPNNDRRKKRIKTKSARSRTHYRPSPSLDIRIPQPQNVPLSMVELYNRMSNAAAVVASTSDDSNDVVVGVNVEVVVNGNDHGDNDGSITIDMNDHENGVDDDDDDGVDPTSNEDEQTSCFTNNNGGAVVLSV